MSELVFEIVNVVIKLLVVLCVTYVIPPAKNLIEKILAERWAKDAVNTAQQVMAKQTGAERKDYVVEKLTTALNEKNIRITEEQINMLIESAVKQMKIEEAKASAPTIELKQVAEEE